MTEPRSHGFFGAVLGGVVVVAAMIFLLTGGQLGGKKVVENDYDLPPVATSNAR